MTSQTFQMSKGMQFGTNLLRNLNRAGIPTGPIKLLSHQGRKSGKTFKTPVAIVNTPEAIYLVAAFGEVNWVKNVRTSGKAGFVRGRNLENFRVEELSANAAAPILKIFLNRFGMVPFIPPYVNTNKNSSLAEFELEAREHAVFRIIKS